ncbi:sugar transferase [Arenibacterium sp. CAU 1754]
MKDFNHDTLPANYANFGPVHSAHVPSVGRFSSAVAISGHASTDAPFKTLARKPAAHKSAKPSPHRFYASVGKRVLDVALVIASLPVLLPLALLCVVAVMLDGGNPFYRQDRLGRNNKVFSILKLRTMVPNADAKLAAVLASDPALRAEWNATQKLKNDPRITRSGAFLRATSLDELPQFWNVLTGEMSLVGPRPMLPEQLPMYGDAEPYFAMRPGISGLWQVSARNENNFGYRAKVDAEYFSNVSFLHDFLILVKTVGVVLRRTGY